MIYKEKEKNNIFKYDHILKETSVIRSSEFSAPFSGRSHD